MRQAVNVYRSQGDLVVESTSMLSGRGRVADGWTQTLPVGTSDAELGAAVLEGIDRSGVIEAGALPTGGPGTTPGSAALGYDTEDAMLADGVPSATVGVKDERWKVTPMINEGPGRGYAGRAEAAPTTHDGPWPPEPLGAAVRSALDAAATLGR